MFLISIRNEMSCGLKMDEREARLAISNQTSVVQRRCGKTNGIKLVLSDGIELRSREVFERTAGAIYVVCAADRIG